MLSGKWHLGHHAHKHTPVGHGFDEFWGVLNCCAAYYSKSYFHPLYGHKIDWRNKTDAVAPAPQEHASELFADFLVDVIENTPRSTPLFLMFTLTAPHSPLQSEVRLSEEGSDKLATPTTKSARAQLLPYNQRNHPHT